MSVSILRYDGHGVLYDNYAIKDKKRRYQRNTKQSNSSKYSFISNI